MKALLCKEFGPPETLSYEEIDDPELKDDTPDEQLSPHDEGNMLCGELELPNATMPCAGQEEGRWRCACHESYLEPVSQVCRSGEWVNYRLNPNRCSQCQGGYSQACE